MKLFARILCFIFALFFMPLWILVNLIFPIIALTYQLGWPKKRGHRKYFTWNSSTTKVTLVYNIKSLLGVKYG